MFNLNPTPINNPSLLLYYAVVQKNPNCFAYAKSCMTRENLIDLLGQVLIIAASVNNLEAVKFILNSPDAVNITPNGVSGLGRAVCLASGNGNLEIVKAILNHPKAGSIAKNGPFSLNLADVTAITAKAFSVHELIESFSKTSM